MLYCAVLCCAELLLRCAELLLRCAVLCRLRERDESRTAKKGWKEGGKDKERRAMGDALLGECCALHFF